MAQANKNQGNGGNEGMMVIKLEKNRKVIKSWEFERVDDLLEKAIIESLDADYNLIKRLTE